MSKADALRLPEYLGHIIEAIERIHRYVADMSEVVSRRLFHLEVTHCDFKFEIARPRSYRLCAATILHEFSRTKNHRRHRGDSRSGLGRANGRRSFFVTRLFSCTTGQRQCHRADWLARKS